MLDDLRNSAASSFIEEEESPSEEQIKQQQRKQRAPLFGMTAPQRFIVAALLFMMVCVLGSFCLILTNRVVLPFF
jgi:hypothetical protein